MVSPDTASDRLSPGSPAIQTFSTCVNSSSTGVARPKIDTATFTRLRSSSTSSTVPLNEVKGPSATRTCSPISKVMVDLGCSAPSLHLVEDAVHFALAQRHGLVVLAEEAGDLRHVLDQVIDLVGQLGVQQHIAGQEFALGIDLLAAADLDHFFGRHQHFVDEFLEALDLAPGA